MNLNIARQVWNLRFPVDSGLYIVTLRTGKKSKILYYEIYANEWRLPGTNVGDKSALIPNCEIIAWTIIPAPLEI